MTPKRLLPLLLSLVLCACATVAKYDASADIHDFLVAVRDGDHAAFDAHVDKPALKAQLRERLISEVAIAHGAQSNATSAALMAGPLVDLGVDILVRPEVFRAAAEFLGYGPDRPIPNALVLGQRVRPMSGDRVCVIIHQACGFVFRREDGVWKMVAFEGDLGALKARLAKRLG